ncbi:hypothetical protein AGABI2DRAFT_66005 [Agaricus bisporus var. bisporus H97]|uniref:hypothetical protein n=1 Tax=Agaricus bisporus var. bisporus (strain H97 / ATCC MYA-4626 / FGSC 10389) TaxID=936046 RepID=UPI00029F6209|nr:hypothetical protein AGABI2DRAFT_66005 [Agaricus bisporus var. bisporus H97]EKV49485.1 hypothetical protein AGABI2DRAFT_66005 [Agaricus bisporus var. bisporus H97]
MSPGRSHSASPGHIRRTSSGQRRVSPYPSPHTSPNPRVKDLPYDGGLEYNGGVLHVDGNLGYPQQQGYSSAYGGLSGSYSPTSTAASAYHTPGQSPSPGPPLTLETAVPKPTVTTGRTANASHRRRKQDAPFVCPIAGCGSTFTRSFNLKGHIRSHNEEKPFLCKWPACGKGFARQHDCKRHEQLHQNYRPFSCEGCSKQFARMDALNRHLRSDGGADCLKLHEASAVAGKMTMNGRTNNENYDLMGGRGGGGLGVTKVEDKAWPAGVVL